MRKINLFKRILMLSLAAFMLFVFWGCPPTPNDPTPRTGDNDLEILCPPPEILSAEFSSSNNSITYSWTTDTLVTEHLITLKINQDTIVLDSVVTNDSATLPLPNLNQTDTIHFYITTKCSHKGKTFESKQVQDVYYLGDIASVAIVYPRTIRSFLCKNPNKKYVKFASRCSDKGTYYMKKDFCDCKKSCRSARTLCNLKPIPKPTQ